MIFVDCKLKDKYRIGDLPLAFAYQMRNAVAHGDFEVDLEIVWRTIHNDLPGLHELIKKVLGGLKRSGNSA